MVAFTFLGGLMQNNNDGSSEGILVLLETKRDPNSFGHLTDISVFSLFVLHRYESERRKRQIYVQGKVKKKNKNMLLSVQPCFGK